MAAVFKELGRQAQQDSEIEKAVAEAQRLQGLRRESFETMAALGVEELFARLVVEQRAKGDRNATYVFKEHPKHHGFNLMDGGGYIHPSWQIPSTMARRGVFYFGSKTLYALTDGQRDVEKHVDVVADGSIVNVLYSIPSPIISEFVERSSALLDFARERRIDPAAVSVEDKVRIGMKLAQNVPYKGAK